MGGSSSEKEISIKTANAVIRALSGKYKDIYPVNIVSEKDFDFINQIKPEDIVFNALHGGFGENGDIQSLFELNNILYTGSDSKSSKICMNKHLSKLIAKFEGLNTPRWVLYKNKRYNKKKLFNSRERKFSYPYIVKPNDEGSTFGLAKVNSEEELGLAISNSLEFSQEIIVEEYIEGREITVGILGNKPLPIVEIFPKHELFDYECKYSIDMTKYKVPAKIKKSIASKIQEDALLIHESIGCRHYSRVDFILDENNNHHFLEINSLPGMTSTSLLPMAAKSVDVEFDELIDIILNMGLRYND